VKRFDMQLIDDRVFVPERVDRLILRLVRHETRQLAQEATGRNRVDLFCSRGPVGDVGVARPYPAFRTAKRLQKNYFFGSAMACAATHCHSPFRSTHVSVNR
jgi:hypothetical protein